MFRVNERAEGQVLFLAESVIAFLHLELWCVLGSVNQESHAGGDSGGAGMKKIVIEILFTLNNGHAFQSENIGKDVNCGQCHTMTVEEAGNILYQP